MTSEAVLRYKTVMSQFDCDRVSPDEFRRIDAIVADFFGLSPDSIFRDLDLLCREKRANIRCYGGDFSEKSSKRESY
ncbi:MAG: hypothetical protein LBM18_01080 [Oscillospiraceae bacterium]|jgi:hypothetical protein|nr:hypothetical protein [Oscillospiraceae bacterium]